jgi:hypothetical protein
MPVSWKWNDAGSVPQRYQHPGHFPGPDRLSPLSPTGGGNHLYADDQSDVPLGPSSLTTLPTSGQTLPPDSLSVDPNAPVNMTGAGGPLATVGESVEQVEAENPNAQQEEALPELPSFSGANRVGTRKDGGVMFDNGAVVYRHGDVLWKAGGNIWKYNLYDGGDPKLIKGAAPKEAIRQDAEGRLWQQQSDGTFKDVTPSGFSTKVKTYRDPGTGLLFDISDPSNPKPVHLPGNPASVDMDSITPGDWSSVPEDMRDVAQSIASYRYPKISGFALRSPYFQQLFKIISKVDPSFDMKNYDARQAFLKDFSGTGKMGQNRVFLNTALDHMNAALERSDQLADAIGRNEDQDQFSAGVVASMKSLGGNKALLNYEADADTLATEYSKALQGGAPDVTEKKEWRDKLIGAGHILMPTSRQREGVMNEMARNLSKRLGEIQNIYRTTMGGMPPFSLLSPESEKTLKRLGTPEAKEVLKQYGSNGGEKPYLDPSTPFSTTSFPTMLSDEERAVVKDPVSGQNYIQHADGTRTPYNGEFTPIQQ